MHPISPIEYPSSWYYVPLAIFIGAGLLVYGMSAAFHRWEKDLHGPVWLDVAGEIAGIGVATFLGGLMGSMLWNTLLGGMTAFVGAWSSNLIVIIIRAKFGIRKEPPQDPTDNA